MTKKIRPFFETTLAKDAQLPGSEIIHKAGARVVIQAELQTKKFGNLFFTTPNATDAFLFEATELAKQCQWLIDRLQKEKTKYTVFSTLNSIPGMTAERAIAEDPDAKMIRHANNKILYRLIVKTSELLFILIAGVEAMVNALIPPTYVHNYTNKKGEDVKLNKVEFEMKIRIEDKLAVLANLKGIDSPKQQKWWSDFKSILDLRNDIVHLKTKNEAFKSHNAVYTELIDLDYKKSVEVVTSLITFFA